jgi:Ca2+-dependent lipid-binding protein
MFPILSLSHTLYHLTGSQVRKYIESELPIWIRHSDSDRAQWLNDFLAKLWPFISNSTESILRGIPLEPYCPSLKFTDVTLGTVPPSIVAVKYCQTEENCARLDLDIKWAGNPKVSA